MNNEHYYIKYIWGPRGQQGYPENNDNVVAFAEGSEKQCERFRNCAGFLLYETYGYEKLKGAGAIYAWGVIGSDQKHLNIREDIGAGGKRWSCGVRVILKKRVDPKDGIPLIKIRELTGMGNIQRNGGLLKITEDQFNKFRGILVAL